MWNRRIDLSAGNGRALYVCKREWQGYGFAWCLRDGHGREVLRFSRARSFYLADGGVRRIKRHHFGILTAFFGRHSWAVVGDQCEMLLIDFAEPHLHWQMTTEHHHIVAAAKLVANGWQFGCEIEVYAEEYLEEILGFCIFWNLRRSG